MSERACGVRLHPAARLLRWMGRHAVGVCFLLIGVWLFRAVLAGADGISYDWQWYRVWRYLGRWTDIFNSIDYLSIFRPEILDVMDRLKAEGFRLAVASATNIEQVERILKENGVASRLERMISASIHIDWLQ